jgi:hypothetical protein
MPAAPAITSAAAGLNAIASTVLPMEPTRNEIKLGMVISKSRFAAAPAPPDCASAPVTTVVSALAGEK